MGSNFVSSTLFEQVCPSSVSVVRLDALTAVLRPMRIAACPPIRGNPTWFRFLMELRSVNFSFQRDKASIYGGVGRNIKDFTSTGQKKSCNEDLRIAEDTINKETKHTILFFKRGRISKHKVEEDRNISAFIKYT